MSPECYDKQGKALSILEWGKLMEDHDYKVVKQEYTPDNKFWISTVWLGLDHSYGGGIPLIFETMVFENVWRKSKVFGKPFDYREEVDMERYSTLTEAIAGHEKLVKKYAAHKGSD